MRSLGGLRQRTPSLQSAANGCCPWCALSTIIARYWLGVCICNDGKTACLVGSSVKLSWDQNNSHSFFTLLRSLWEPLDNAKASENENEQGRAKRSRSMLCIHQLAVQGDIDSGIC